jgi:cell division protease FtsH
MKKRTPPEIKVPGKFDPQIRLLIIYFVTTLMVLWVWQELVRQVAVVTIPYSEFKAYVSRHEVTEATIQQDEIVGRIVPHAPPAAKAAELSTKAAVPSTKPAETQPSFKPAASPVAAASPSPIAAASPSPTSTPAPTNPFFFRTVRVEDPDLVNELQAAGVNFSGTRPSVLSQFLMAWVLPILILFGLWSLLARRFRAAGEGVFGIGKSRAKLIIDKNTGVTFGDVAGCDEAKQELEEVVDFLKNPKDYESLGAKIPKGALLVGPPGTGKTLLSRAVAGEAGVPFFSLSGADFVEMFVGVGAARVRDLFQQAKQHAPCIIFIDELDAIGRQRGVHVGAVNDEREQTLNALLVEMDGFEANTGVIVLAATNRPEVLDRALLRPGRFDRQIVVDAPDLDGREAILKVHARGKKLSADVDLRRLAAATAGMSGADLANVLNEAALLTARRKANATTQRDLEEAVEKVVAGPERRSRRLNEDEKRRVAYHEVGHALVAAYSEHADPVHKISIVPRGRAALGYTMQLPTEDQFLLTRTELMERLSGLLGGRAAEEIVFGEVTTGAQNDLERATALARQMVAVYGMSESIGLVSCVQRQSAFWDGQMQRDCSEATARDIDEEVKVILDHAYDDAKQILSVHSGQLEKIAEELLKRESLDAQEFYRLVGKEMPRAKEPAPPLPEPVA